MEESKLHISQESGLNCFGFRLCSGGIFYVPSFSAQYSPIYLAFQVWSDVICLDHTNAPAVENVFLRLYLEDAQACILNAKFQGAVAVLSAASLCLEFSVSSHTR